MQNLWGFQTVNDCGVLVDDLEEMTLISKGQVSVSVRLAESGKGYWLYGLSVMTSTSGTSFAPSVFERIGYRSKDAAMRAAQQRAIDWLAMESRQKSLCDSEENTQNISYCLDELKNPPSHTQMPLL